MEVKNSVAFVTGANRGLGLAFTIALLNRKAGKIYAAARDPLSITLPGVVPVKLDVTSPEDVARVARECSDVTLLINNAGIATGTPLLAPNSATKAREEFETNVLGPLELTRAFAPVLARNGGGAIVNVLSVLSWLNVPGWATYAVSKAAAWSLTNGLRGELAAQKTQVVGLHVGYLETDMAKTVNEPKSEPLEVAHKALAAVQEGLSEALADDASVHVRASLSAGIYLGNA